ncbi:restriction endonuclease subunit S [Arcanobacterium ihumii]|uniref:restriction endonuclease subunit S n=1 Tax=Arcanobacterium ihumii TaxID=2138162 RepID=UPI001F2C8758|nr:hypothetical protein [Arcanobacterium ihumii]
MDELVADVIDCPHSTPNWTPDGKRVVRNFNLKDGNLDFSDGYFVDESTYLERVRRALPEPYDIIISREAPIGTVGIVPPGLECCLGQRLVLLKTNPERCSAKYLVFALMSEYAKTQFRRANATGSIASNLTIPALRDIKVPIVENCESVGELLWSINSAIQLNSKIIETTQAMMSTIYNYWFVQFDFPDDRGRPYRTSGGKMVWNETLNREIPYGWTAIQLQDILRKNSRTLINKSSQPTIDLSVMPSRSIGLSTLNSSDEFSSNLFGMHEGDILFGGIRPYLKKAGIAPCNGAVAGTVRSFSVRRPEDYNFAMCTFASDSMFDFAMRVSTGTRMPTVSSDALLSRWVPYDERTVAKFGMLNLKDTVISSVKEILQLKNLRDWLLQGFMSGQAKLSELPETTS